VRRALQCLVHRPSLAAEAGEHAALARVRLAGIEGLVAVLDALAERPDLRTAGLIERFRDSDLGAYLARLAAAPDPAAEGVSPEAEWQGAMRGLRLRLDEERLDELQRKLRSDGLSAQEKVEYGRLLRAVRPGPC
jgi:DNA primase